MPPKTRPPEPEHRRTPTQLLADIALAQASRRPLEHTSKVTHTWNAKGDVQASIEVDHVDPYEAWRISSELLDLSMAKYPRKENGA